MNNIRYCPERKQNPFRVMVCKNGKNWHVGYYETEAGAAAALREARLRIAMKGFTQKELFRAAAKTKVKNQTFLEEFQL